MTAPASGGVRKPKYYRPGTVGGNERPCPRCRETYPIAAVVFESETWDVVAEKIDEVPIAVAVAVSEKI